MSKELKPCPFCGGTELASGYNDEDGYWIECDSCYPKGVAVMVSSHESKELAITAWNCRACGQSDGECDGYNCTERAFIDAELDAKSRRADQPRWVEWSVACSLPLQAMYLVTLDDGFLAICPADSFEKEFVIAYWSEPLPPPYQQKERAAS